MCCGLMVLPLSRPHEGWALKVSYYISVAHVPLDAGHIVNLIPRSSSSGFVPKKQWSRLALKGLSEEVRALGLAFDDQARSSNRQILCWNRSASSAQVCPLISSGCTRELHLLLREHEVDLELWWGAFILRTVPRTVCNLVSPASPKFVRLKSPRYR